MDLLRPRFPPHLDPNSFPFPDPAPAARTEAVPDSLPAHFLDDAPPLAAACICLLRRHRAPHPSASRPLLAKQPIFAAALFGCAAGHRPCRSASHGLRSRSSRARVPAALRLDRNSTQRFNDASTQTPSLPRIRAAPARPARPLDTPAAHRSRDAGYPVCVDSIRGATRRGKISRNHTA